jgi:hypothetical protein
MSDPTDTREESARLVAERTAGVLSPVLERLNQLRDAVLATRPASGPWTEQQLHTTQSTLLGLLEQDALHVGMGFVAEPAVVDDRERFMYWWQMTAGRTSRLRLNFDRSSIDVYDYAEMEWFTQPRQGRARVLFGPYVDYSGSELYIVTATTPVVVDGAFCGVVGVDLLFPELERRLLGALRQAPADAVLVNAERRVVSANSPRWVLGSRLRALPEAGAEVDGTSYVATAPLPDDTGWTVGLAETEEH